MRSLSYINFNFRRNETEELKKKLENLEKKIIVGGENLLEKVENQEHLLEQAAKELEERKAREEHLTKQIKQKEVTESKISCILCSEFFIIHIIVSVRKIGC